MNDSTRASSTVAERLRRHRKEAGDSFLQDCQRPQVKGPFYNTDWNTSKHVNPGDGSQRCPGDDNNTTALAEVKIVLDEKDVDSQLEWQTQRHIEKITADDSRARKQISELLESNLQKPLHLHSIRITNATLTRPSFLQKVLSPYLTTLREKTPEPNLGDILKTSKDLQHHFERLDIFSSLSQRLQPSSSILSTEHDVDLVIDVKEQGKYFLRTATDVGNGEGSATGTARIRNAFGGAETFEANVGFGTKTKSSLQIRAEVPVLGRWDQKLEASVHVAERDLSHFASCSERLKGATLRFKVDSAVGHHEFGYEVSDRHISQFTPNASASMRKYGGHSLKSSLSHTFTLDTRDDPFLASRGVYFRTMQEYAGLAGDASFVKGDLETWGSRAITPKLVMSLGGRAGAICPLNGKSSLFSDRFQLGGPTSVRMFRINTLGPKDNGDYLGGNLYWALGTSIFAPFPTKPDWPLKLHGFLNAGKLVASLQDVRTCNRPSVSAGLGLIYRHSLVRIELNVGVPLTAQVTDGTRKGLQLGLGLNFLS